jgi:hypothetical protein
VPHRSIPSRQIAAEPDAILAEHRPSSTLKGPRIFGSLRNPARITSGACERGNGERTKLIGG